MAPDKHKNQENDNRGQAYGEAHENTGHLTG